ncbi:hypothetical protein FVE89_27955 [Methylobacterium sp. 2A]|nr:hypothetical protein [Methylobacterium sp. 2A]
MPAPAGLEGALQPAARCLEPSFEASATLRHLRMRGMDGMSEAPQIRCPHAGSLATAFQPGIQPA